MQQPAMIRMLLIAVFFSACISGPEARPATSQDKAPVTCIIWPEKRLVPRGAMVNIHIVLENNSSQDLLITSMAAHLESTQGPASGVFYKPGAKYWSPIDVETKGVLKPVNNPNGGWTYPARKMVVPSRRLVEFTLDLSRLEWSDQISSSLPSLHLYAVAPNGDYQLYFFFQAGDGPDLTSRRTSLTIGAQRP